MGDGRWREIGGSGLEWGGGEGMKGDGREEEVRVG